MSAHCVFLCAVVVLCASAHTVRKIMLKAAELHFDNGEYVFINIDLFSTSVYLFSFISLFSSSSSLAPWQGVSYNSWEYWKSPGILLMLLANLIVS